MNNKILVDLVVPDIEEVYSVFLPLNKQIGNIILLLNKSIREITNNSELFIKETNCLYNSATGNRYNAKDKLKDTDIRNGCKLILM